MFMPFTAACALGTSCWKAWPLVVVDPLVVTSVPHHTFSPVFFHYCFDRGDI